MEKNKDIFDKRNFYTEEDSGKVFLLSLIVPLIVSLLVFMVCSAIASMAGVKAEEATSQVWFNAIGSVFSTFSFLLVYYLYNKKMNISQKVVKFDFKIGWKNNIIAIFLGIICLLGLQFFISLFDKLWVDLGFQFQSSIDVSNFGLFVLYVFISAVAPAICEEIVFRGMILNGLRNKFKDSISILLSAFMFALMHGSLQQLIYPFIFGSILGLLYLRTGSIIPCIVAHFINNFFVLFFNYLYNATGFSFSLPLNWWGILLAVAFAVIVFVIVFLLDKYFYKHKNKYEVEKITKDSNNLFKNSCLFLWVSIAIAFVFFLFSTISSLMG